MLPPFHPSGVLPQTVRFHRDPLGFLRSARAELGDVFAIRLLTARPLFVVAEPEAAAALLAADHGSAHAGAARREILPFASERSVFGGDGEAHRAARRRIAPALGAEAMAARREAMAAVAARHARSWPAGRPFRLLERLRDVTDEIFVRLVLGVRDEALAGQLIAAIRGMLNTPGNPPVTLPGAGDGLAGWLGQQLFERRQAPVAACLSRAVEARRGGVSMGGGGEPDVLGCMVEAGEALGTEAIVAELMSLLMAAQEPPAIALTWMLDRIGREPELPAAFESEPEGEVAAAALRETLRLQPPASAALRRLARPLAVGSAVVPAGADAMVPSALLQRDERFWEEPGAYRPGRWAAADPPPAFYFPFGGGDRRCVGEHLARAELATVLPAVLREVRLRPLAASPEPPVQRATVLVPKRSLLAVAEPRTG